MINSEMTKKSRNPFDRSMLCIENFSDEIFFEVFDYLDGCHIYQAFSNLNHRFDQLLHSPLLLVKVHLDEPTSEEISQNKYPPIILLNKQQILSLELCLTDQCKDLFSSFTIDLSLSHLESLTVHWIDRNVIIPFLVNLASLPRLISLTISIQDTSEIINDIYRLIFALSTLKYISLDTYIQYPSISLPMANKPQFSAIETLVIEHHCTFDDLAYLTSYTPQLRHLSVTETTVTDVDIETMLPMNLPNLICLHIDLHSKTFDELEMIMTRIGSKLNVLSCFVALNTIFLDGYRWKQLILRYLPHLKKFLLRFNDTIYQRNEKSINYGEPHQFASSFWFERRWILKFTICGDCVSYSINPYRQRWYDDKEDEIVKSTRLIIYEHFDIMEIIRTIKKRLLIIAPIYHLKFSKATIFADVFIRIIDFLPDLMTLEIDSLSCGKSRYSSKNKISKVYLHRMDNIDELDRLLAMCPSMNYLQIEHLNIIDIQLFLDRVLKKIPPNYLRSLCFRIPTVDDQIIQILQKSIDHPIKRVGDQIYLQWK